MQTNVFHYDSCGEFIVKTQDFKCFNVQVLPIVLQNIQTCTSTCNSRPAGRCRCGDLRERNEPELCRKTLDMQEGTRKCVYVGTILENVHRILDTALQG